MTDFITSRPHFDKLRHRAQLAIHRGELETALGLYDEARAWAEEHGDADDLDKVSCNRIAVLIHLGRAEGSAQQLQMILMRSTSSVNRHLAAYNLSIYYDLRDNIEKSRFYARLALTHSEQTESALFQARCHNLLGNLWVRESRFEKALAEYRQALEHFPAPASAERTVLQVNVGYCHLTCGRYREGFEHLFQARRNYRRLDVGEGHGLVMVRLALSFGYLEIGRSRRARLHGAVSLQLAERCGDRDLIKKALYMLGETEKLCGDELAAYTYFCRLQEEFYPENPYLPDLLLDNDTNKLVNLWA